jgi:hypothetical protein
MITHRPHAWALAVSRDPFGDQHLAGAPVWFWSEPPTVICGPSRTGHLTLLSYAGCSTGAAWGWSSANIDSISTAPIPDSTAAASGALPARTSSTARARSRAETSPTVSPMVLTVDRRVLPSQAVRKLGKDHVASRRFVVIRRGRVVTSAKTHRTDFICGLPTAREHR